MKKICIDVRLISSAGIGTYLKGILKSFLKKSSFDIYLIVNKKNVRDEKWLQNDKFKLIYLNANIYSIKEQILLPLKVPKCDIFFSPHFNIPILPIRAKKRIVTIHDVYHLAFFKKLKFLEKIYAKFVINRALKKSVKIITVSNFSKTEILKYTKAKEEKINVIHNGIDFEIFKKSKNEEEIEIVTKKFDLPKKYFLFVGNFKAHKNIKNILKAFEKLIEEKKDIFLVIVGSNKNLINAIDVQEIINENKNLKEKIKILENVSSLELPIIYQLSISLVFPSFYEGFGYPPLESIACGSCAIVSDRAFFKETLLDAAIFVDPEDVNEIKESMLKVLLSDKLKDFLIKKGENRLKLFDKKNSLIKHIEMFEEMIR